MSMNLWPDNEKPREKLLSLGAPALSNAELLAVLFGSGNKYKDILTLCRDLIANYGSLHNLFSASLTSLSQHVGIGVAKFCQLMACAELNRRHLSEPLTEEQQFVDSAAVKGYLTAVLRNLDHEVFAGLFFDIKLRLIRYEVLFTGTVDLTVVYPREVTKRALVLNATSVIIAHNHPSGDVNPSQADLTLTKRINQALSLVDIRLLDHIIVAGAKVLSFSEQGHLYEDVLAT